MEEYLSKETIDQIMEYISLYGLNLVAAILIFFVGKWIAKRIKNIALKAFNKTKLDITLATFLSNVIYAVLLSFIVIAVLNKVGVETTSLVAIVGAAGLAIGLAFQGSVSNIAAGIMLVVLRPFKVGDYVETAGTAGKIKSIDIMTTNLTTPDNKKIVIPNKMIFDDVIINYSAQKQRRIDLVFGIGYDDDIKKAKKILDNIISKEKRILDNPEPVIGVVELADSSVNIACRPWVKTADYWDVYFALMENVKLRFDKEGITIPYPQREITQKIVKK